MIAFRYLGGKNLPQLNSWVRSLLPGDADLYCEPCAGSLGVLINRAPARVEVANDNFGDLINFFRVLRQDPDRLIEALLYTMYSREDFAHAAAVIRGKREEQDPLERARCWYVVVRQGWGSVVSHGSWNHPRPDLHLNEARTTANAVEVELPEVARRLRRVVFEHDDAMAVIERYDAPGTLFYIDPPYLMEGRHGGEGKKARDYGDESGDLLHHRLLEVLPALQAKVALSHHSCAFYDALGWNKATLSYKNKVANATDKEAVLEAVYMNYDPPAQQVDLF